MNKPDDNGPRGEEHAQHGANGTNDTNDIFLGTGRLSSKLHRLREHCSAPHTTYGSLVLILNQSGHAFIALFFCVPFVLPIPLPGVSQVFGPVIGLAGFYMMMNWPAWLPKKWESRQISGQNLAKIFGAGEKVLRRVETFLKPRGKLAQIAWTQRVTGFFILLCAGFLSLPYPPGTNAPPALAILLMSLGTLERDTVVLLAGYVLVFINIVLFTFLTLLGVEGLKLIFEKVF